MAMAGPVTSNGPVALTRWLGQLKAALPIARLGVDPEGVHQLRVALARIRLWLWLGRWHALRDDVDWLRSAAAAARDIDVRASLGAGDGGHALRGNPAARRQLLAALSSPRTAALLEALPLLPPVPADTVRERTRELARRVCALGRTAERRPHDSGALHQLRCAVRRLRYALECRGLPAAEVTALQDSLGEACDCALAMARHGAPELALRRNKAERAALKQWYALKAPLRRLAVGRGG